MKVVLKLVKVFLDKLAELLVNKIELAFYKITKKTKTETRFL